MSASVENHDNDHQEPQNHVLLMEDDETTRALIREILRAAFPAIEITGIANHVGFFRALQSGKFNIVITGHKLHWATGAEVLSAVKSLDISIPVIMMVEPGDEAEAKKELKAGLYAYIMRSDDIGSALLPPIRSALQIAESQDKAVSQEEHLRDLLERLDIGTFSATLDGTLLNSNEAFLGLLAVDLIDDPYEDDALAAFRQLRNRQAPESELKEEGQVRRFAEELINSDGESVWLSLVETCTRAADGELIVEGVVEDISSRRQTTEEEPEPACDLQQPTESAIEPRLIPLVTLADQTIVGLEAYVDHMPGQSRPESYGTETGRAGHAVNATVEWSCRQLLEWREALPGADQIFITTNLDLVHINDTSMLNDLSTMLQESDLHPGSLILSLNAHSALEYGESAHMSLALLREIGVKLCADNFSTVFLSLPDHTSRLFTTARIDVGTLGAEGRDHCNWPVLKEVFNMARRLDLEVIAKGVEHEAQIDCLKEVGCEMVQGHLTGQSVTASEATTQLWSSLSK